MTETEDTIIAIKKKEYNNTIIKLEAEKKELNEMNKLYIEALNKKPKEIIKEYDPTTTDIYMIYEEVKKQEEKSKQRIRIKYLNIYDKIEELSYILDKEYCTSIGSYIYKHGEEDKISKYALALKKKLKKYERKL
jgi:hypothetical protein